MLSNSDTDYIRQLYALLRIKNLRISTVEARRAINSNADKRGIINEVVITNY
jgi:DNA adenine methylase